MNKPIVIRVKKIKFDYYLIDKYGDEELYLSHLIGGESRYYEGMHGDVCKLAAAHGWKIEEVK